MSLCREQASVVLKQKPVLDKLGIQITGIVSQRVCRAYLWNVGKLTLARFYFPGKRKHSEEIKSFREDVGPEPLFMDEKLEFYTAVGGGKKK